MGEKLVFQTDEGEVTLVVIEQTRLNGADYLLVSEDTEEEEAGCLILKDVSGAEEKEARYEPVEDEALVDALMKIFAELLPEDTTLA